MLQQAWLEKYYNRVMLGLRCLEFSSRQTQPVREIIKGIKHLGCNWCLVIAVQYPVHIGVVCGTRLTFGTRFRAAAAVRITQLLCTTEFLGNKQFLRSYFGLAFIQAHCQHPTSIRGNLCTCIRGWSLSTNLKRQQPPGNATVWYNMGSCPKE